MAKLNSNGWTSRSAVPSPSSSALSSAITEEEDEAYLRPSAPALPQRKGRARRASAQDLVPNYDPVFDRGEDTEPFLRSRRRVPPRKGGRLRALGRTRVGRVLLILFALMVVGFAGAGAWAVHSFLQHDPHFRIDSSASIEATGITELSRSELVNVFGSDIGRNVFFVPLVRREAALEATPWVRHATVMRVLPNIIRVTIEERVPIAFVRVGREIELVDAQGVLLSMAPATLARRHYSFPVVVGLDPNGLPAARADRMHLFQRFVSALDGGGAKVSSQLSEVDLTDLDDVRAVVPAQGTDILLHFGNSDFLERYRSYQEHLPEWRQQYPNLSAVDLRYDRQVVLKMADAAEADEAAESKPLVDPRPDAGKKIAASRKLPAKKVAAAFVRPVGKPAAAHSTKAARTWYTERAGPHHAVRWVPHPVSNAGRSPR